MVTLATVVVAIGTRVVAAEVVAVEIVELLVTESTFVELALTIVDVVVAVTTC